MKGSDTLRAWEPPEQPLAPSPPRTPGALSPGSTPTPGSARDGKDMSRAPEKRGRHVCRRGCQSRWVVFKGQRKKRETWNVGI